MTKMRMKMRMMVADTTTRAKSGIGEAWEEPRAGNYGIGGTLRYGSGKGRQGRPRRAKEGCDNTKKKKMKMMRMVAVIRRRQW